MKTSNRYSIYWDIHPEDDNVLKGFFRPGYMDKLIWYNLTKFKQTGPSARLSSHMFPLSYSGCPHPWLTDGLPAFCEKLIRTYNKCWNLSNSIINSFMTASRMDATPELETWPVSPKDLKSFSTFLLYFLYYILTIIISSSLLSSPKHNGLENSDTYSDPPFMGPT